MSQISTSLGSLNSAITRVNDAWDDSMSRYVESQYISVLVSECQRAYAQMDAEAQNMDRCIDELDAIEIVAS